MFIANRDLEELPAAAAAALEQLVRRFEESWRRGERPANDTFLPANPPARRAALIELVHADLEYHVQAGEPVRVEDYLRRYPELCRDAAVVRELREAETELRGGPPAVPREGRRGRSDPDGLAACLWQQA